MNDGLNDFQQTVLDTAARLLSSSGDDQSTVTAPDVAAETELDLEGVNDAFRGLASDDRVTLDDEGRITAVNDSATG